MPFISAILNNLINFFTGFASNELAYGFRVNDNVNLLEDLPPQDFEKLRLIKREAADEAIAFANVMTKARYDGKHTPLNLKEGDEVYLRLHHGYKIPGEGNRKLHQQRVGPFSVISKVGNLAYKLNLPPIMKIWPVVSVAQLEPTPEGNDPYRRLRPTNPPPVEDEDRLSDSYEIEKILEKRIVRGKPEYLLKWLDYGPQDNVWYKLEDLGFAKDLVDEYERTHVKSTSSRGKRRNLAITEEAIMRASKTIASVTVTRSPRVVILTKTLTPVPRNLPAPRLEASDRLVIISSDSTVAFRRSSRVAEF